jgi:hypothetical protein
MESHSISYFFLINFIQSNKIYLTLLILWIKINYCKQCYVDTCTCVRMHRIKLIKTTMILDTLFDLVWKELHWKCSWNKIPRIIRVAKDWERYLRNIFIHHSSSCNSGSTDQVFKISSMLLDGLSEAPPWAPLSRWHSMTLAIRF